MNEPTADQAGVVQSMGLRARKKHLTQVTIEDTALRLFQKHGYEQTSIQDIADAVMMSPRTFFRYFTSKEDLLFAPAQMPLTAGIAFLQHSAPEEPLISALAATFMHMAGIYQQQHERFLICYQIAIATPTLVSAYLYSLATLEPKLCAVLATREEAHMTTQHIRLLVAMAMAAFRNTIEIWLEQEANGDLVASAQENLEPLWQIAKGFLENV